MSVLGSIGGAIQSVTDPVEAGSRWVIHEANGLHHSIESQMDGTVNAAGGGLGARLTAFPIRAAADIANTMVTGIATVPEVGAHVIGHPVDTAEQLYNGAQSMVQSSASMFSSDSLHRTYQALLGGR